MEPVIQLISDHAGIARIEFVRALIDPARLRGNSFVGASAAAAKTVVSLVAALLLSSMTLGCQLHKYNWTADSIPASRIDNDLFGCSRDALVAVEKQKLGQVGPAEHLIDAGDVLSVFIFGVFPPGPNETPVVNQQQGLNPQYYPPNGSIVAPATGLPIRVGEGGILDLPLIVPLQVKGLTVQQLTEAIRQSYLKENILLEGQGRITVTLIIPRTHRIVVLREDATVGPMTLSSPSVVEQTHRGTGNVVDLPAYENDVLHALTATGGLPGSDAANEVYVVRASGGWTEEFLSADRPYEIIQDGTGLGIPHEELIKSTIRIPLAAPKCVPISFQPSDVILNDGDILFVPRRREYFYTGGILPGGRVPLPRDEDLDIIEAISMCGASPGGPMGQDGRALALGKHTFLAAATRAIVLRRLADGRQLNIRVDLDRAMHDPKERLRILPDDVVMLYQKPHAALFNALWNAGSQ